MKLKDEDIIEITKLVDQGLGYRRIATKFNINKTTAQRLIERYKMHGLESVLHRNRKSFTIDEKMEIINRYYAGESKSYLSIEINVSNSVVDQWISKYEKLGYNGLIDNRGRPGETKMGRPRKNPKIEETTSTNEAMAPLTDEERHELNELRKKTYQQQMEIDCLKKIQALVQQRQNRQTKKK